MDEIKSLAAPSTLELFSLPPTQLAITSQHVTEHRPISTLNSDSAITFVIKTPNDEYIDLKDTLFRLKLQINIKKADDSAAELDDWQYIAPCNYLLHSIFKDVILEWNGKLITPSSQNYAYKSIFEVISGFTNDAKKSYLSSSLYYEDDGTDKEAINTKATALIKPKIKSKSSKILDLFGKLHLDIAFQEKAIIGGSELKLTLIPNSPSFYLRADTTKVKPTVEFLDSSLFVQRSKVSPSIVEAHELALKHSNAKYPISRNEVKSYIINSGTMSTNIDNIVTGQLPRRALVAFVSNTAYNGSFGTNPFNFKNYNINFISSFIDGVQYPTIPYKPDFQNRVVSREYLGLFEAYNQLTTDATINIDKDSWIDGRTIFGFNYSQDSTNGVIQEGHANPIKRGTLGLQIGFSNATTETINVLIYLEYDNLIQIDFDKKVNTDYN